VMIFNGLKSIEASKYEREVFQRPVKVQLRKPSDIKEKTFCILNNRGYGDTIPSVCVADILKRHGAHFVAFGIDHLREPNAYRFFPAIDYIFQRTHDWQRFDHLIKLINQVDYLIDQDHFEFENNHDFYSHRLANAGVIANEIRPEIKVPENYQAYALNELLPKLGVKPFEYLVFHPQAHHQSRTLKPKAIKEVLSKLQRKTILIGRQMEFENCINFTWNQPIIETFLLLYYSRAFIGVDSGWNHFSFCMRKESFIFYSCTNEKMIFNGRHRSIGFVQSVTDESGIEINDWEAFNVFCKRHIEHDTF